MARKTAIMHAEHVPTTTPRLVSAAEAGALRLTVRMGRTKTLREKVVSIFSLSYSTIKRFTVRLSPISVYVPQMNTVLWFVGIAVSFWVE